MHTYIFTYMYIYTLKPTLLWSLCACMCVFMFWYTNFNKFWMRLTCHPVGSLLALGRNWSPFLFKILIKYIFFRYHEILIHIIVNDKSNHSFHNFYPRTAVFACPTGQFFLYCCLFVGNSNPPNLPELNKNPLWSWRNCTTAISLKSLMVGAATFVGQAVMRRRSTLPPAG